MTHNHKYVVDKQETVSYTSYITTHLDKAPKEHNNLHDAEFMTKQDPTYLNTYKLTYINYELVKVQMVC